MDIETYRLKQAAVQAEVATKGRRLQCPRCLQPGFSCYCELLEPFSTKMMFVILIHPIEVARRIATGRMAHLCLTNSRLIVGHNFTQNESVNALLNDPGLHPVMLYPGSQATNLSHLSSGEKAKLTPEDKTLAVFVIDGTWNTARRTVFHSDNLRRLPRICFSPDKASGFLVRKQPRPECYSTIEAIHQSIDLLNPVDRRHDHLLYVFQKMVARQLELAHSMTWSPWSKLQI